MNRACLTLITALGGASCVLASEAGNMPAHTHLLFRKTTTTFELTDGATITWVATPASGANQSAAAYEVTIKREKAEPRTYSLLTLGVQSVTNEARILGPLPAGVEILGPDGSKAAAATDAPAGLRVLPTGLKPEIAGKPRIINDGKVYFISFKTAEVVLKVQILSKNQPFEKVTEWKRDEASTFGTGHDNTPPKNPPD